MLRLGLIGAGRWGTRYLATVRGMASAQITTVCTSRTLGADVLPPDARVVRRASDLITSPDCDAVIVCTPPATHAALVREAIAAGKPVMVEKPLCLDTHEARSLDAAVRQSGVPVLVNHIHLFGPAHEPLRAAVDGRGGVRGIICEGSGFGSFRLDTPALWDWGAHDVALALDLVGRMPVRVDALGVAWPGHPHGEPENVAIALDFGHAVTGWIVTGCMTLERRRSITVFCESAAFTVVEAARTITLTEFEIDVTHRYDAPGAAGATEGTVRLVSADRPLTLAVEHFVSGVRGGPTRHFGTGLGADVVEVLARADRACALRASAPPL